MYRSFAGGFRILREGAVGELDAPAVFKQWAEERRNRLALGDGVCRHVGKLPRAWPSVEELFIEALGLGMPGSDVVKVPVLVLAPHALHVFGLFFSLGVLPNERRIAEDIGGAGGGWENLSPIEFEGVAVGYVCGNADR